METDPLQTPPPFRSRGAFALCVLHEQHLRDFVVVWKQAQRLGVVMPATEDPDCADLNQLLRHTLAAAGGYIVWIAQQLGLATPALDPCPPAETIADQVDATLEQVLAVWRWPLRDIEEQALHHPTYVSRWGVPYCIDAMLEHAVMHPLRHTHQLRGIMAVATV